MPNEFRHVQAYQHLEKGQSLESQGLLDEAMLEFKRAVEADPRIATARNALGNHYRRKGLLTKAADEYRKGMCGVHTILNAMLTIWGITMHGTDFSRVIGEVVAMGQDNDCTAATAGSIVGAVVGRAGIPKHWYKRFNNTVYTYMIKRTKFRIDDVVKRFGRQAGRVFGSM